jgi:hypothetical protein
LHFALDALGNPITLKDAVTETTPVESYQYDPLYRLQQVNDSTGALWQSYTYDKRATALPKPRPARCQFRPTLTRPARID